MTFRILISLAPFMLATGVSAQQTGTLSGYVADRATGPRVSDVLVLIKAESGESSASRTAGIAVLGLVAPAVTALSNRVIRVLR